MSEKKIKFILFSLGYLFLALFCLLPVAFMFVVSLSSRPDFLLPEVNLSFSLSNYLEVVKESSLHFLDYLSNSLLVSFLSSTLAVCIASLAAYAFTRLKLAGKAGLLIAILALSLFPQISLVGFLFKLMNSLGWINTYPALIFPYIAWVLPLSVWILVSYFSQIPEELDRAGLIDGGSRWKIFWKIILPLARPGIFSVFLLAFIFAFNEFMFALVLTTDFHARTISVGIALFQGLHGEIPWGEIMAGSAIAVLPLMALVVIFQKHIISGLLRGALKG